jgi:D-alanine-D-alanine ligase
MGDPGFEDEAEFDSPKTIAAIAGAIKDLNYNIVPIEATKDLAEELQTHGINVVFNIAEGLADRGREAQVPAVCDLLGIEHTGSDATCMSITLDKALTKKIVAAEGIQCPRSILYTRPPRRLPKNGLKYPVIVKPNQEGTSKGIDSRSVVTSDEELLEKIEWLHEQFQAPILAEEYIVGREFTVGVLGNRSARIIGPMEIEFKPQPGLDHPVYTMDIKFEADPLNNPMLNLVCPVELEPETTESIRKFARKVFDVLGCRDVARIDFRIDTNNVIQFFEINPLPGLTPGFSDLVIMAEKSGMAFQQLMKQILMPAIRRWRMHARQLDRPNQLPANDGSTIVT